jgi:ribosomal-protein-alanine N-acetyltransferase
VIVDPVRTERMVLRTLEAGDKDAFLRVHELSAELYRKWLPALAPGDSWHDVFERSLLKGMQDTQLRMVGVVPDGRIAGFFNLSEIVRGVFHNAYASWSTSAEFIRQGYGTEGVTALLDIGFHAERGLSLHRVQANIIPSNEASIRLARRAGFREEGLALRYLKIAGEWQDHLMFAKTVEEHVPTYL